VHQAQAAVRRVTAELADLAEATAKDAQRLLANAKRALHRARATAAGQRARGERDPTVKGDWLAVIDYEIPYADGQRNKLHLADVGSCAGSD
jgi:hypothetical protein